MMTRIINEGDPYGKLTEELVEKILDNAGLTKGNGRYYGSYENARNGLDVVFFEGSISNPTKIYVFECKQLTSGGSASLNSANPTTGLPSQMKEDWIRYIANNKLSGLGGIQEQTANAIRLAPMGTIEKYVVAVDKVNSEINFLKLGENF